MKGQWELRGRDYPGCSRVLGLVQWAMANCAITEGSWRAVGLSKHGSCCPAGLLGSRPRPSLQGSRPGVCGHVLLPPGHGEVSSPLCSRGQCVVAEARLHPEWGRSWAGGGVCQRLYFIVFEMP